MTIREYVLSRSDSQGRTVGSSQSEDNPNDSYIENRKPCGDQVVEVPVLLY